MEFIFKGIDGTNLLGFLAALGVFRSLAEENGTVTLGWREEKNGAYRPVLTHPEAANETELIEILARVLGVGSEPLECLAKWKNLPKNLEFAEYLIQVRDGSDERIVEFVTALGSASLSQDQDPVDDTGFRTMGGAGHQDFLGFMSEIHRQTTTCQLYGALFERWTYVDSGLAMRWDPIDYRPHALRAEDPTKASEKTVSVRGANRLAMEALPLFPVLPGTRRNNTVAFDKTAIQWPIWESSLSLSTVRSLLLCCPAWVRETREPKARSKRQKPVDRRLLFEGRGIRSVWVSARFTEGRFRNFKPATRVL